MQFLGLKILLSTCARIHGACTIGSPASCIDQSVTGRLMEMVSKNGQALGSFARLVHLMKTKLPQEIVDRIEETVYQHVFCPGVVYLPRQRRYRKAVMWQGKAYYLLRLELLRLSKAIHSGWQERLWTDNIYVLGGNSYSFLRRLKEGYDAGRPYDDIQVAHVMLTFRLYKRRQIDDTGIREDLGLLCDTCNRLTFPDHIRIKINRIVRHTHHRWIREIWWISKVLWPKKLTLDFTKCYVPENRCLALEWIQKGGLPLEYLPSEIEVIASDRVIEARIMRLLRLANTG